MDDLSALILDFVVFLALMVGLEAWVNRAQDEYLRAYTEVTRLPAPTSRQLLLMATRPWRLLTSSPLTLRLRALNTRQDNAHLEILRQRCQSRQRMAFVGAAIAFFALVAVRFG